MSSDAFVGLMFNKGCDESAFPCSLIVAFVVLNLRFGRKLEVLALFMLPFFYFPAFYRFIDWFD